MIMQKFGGTGYTISRITYGGIVSTDDGQAASDRYVAWAIDQGVNYFDVAPTYGDAEEKLGNSLRPYRSRVHLACKTEKRMCSEAEESLRRSMELLHTDYFDVYQLHGLSTMDEVDKAFGPKGVMEMMIRLKRDGIARKLGITCHSQEVALRCMSLYDFDTVLFPFNWHMHMAHGMGQKLIEAAKARNMGVLCMKSMIERAWDDSVDAEARKKFPKSWCKPIDPDDDPELLLAALKYAASLGVDTIIPPGNWQHFKFAVDHVNEIFGTELTTAEKELLAARLKCVQDRPFFDPAEYHKSQQ